MSYDKLSNYATTVSDVQGMTVVTYQSTGIVQWDNEKIILDTGGWKSATTKKKMNQASNQFNLGYSVYAKRGEWFIDYKGETIPFEGSKITLNR